MLSPTIAYWSFAAASTNALTRLARSRMRPPLRPGPPATGQRPRRTVNLVRVLPAAPRRPGSMRTTISIDGVSSKTFRSTLALLSREWRRRDSNPRPRTHRPSVYKLRPRLGFRPDGWFTADPPAGLAILWSRAAGDWLSFGASPFSDAGSRATGRARADTLLVVQTRQRVRDGFPHLRLVSGCLTRPTGDLGLQLCRRTDHVETMAPPYVRPLHCIGRAVGALRHLGRELREHQAAPRRRSSPGVPSPGRACSSSGARRSASG
jgi:hypothetical protein